jgi:hypothetical protein
LDEEIFSKSKSKFYMTVYCNIFFYNNLIYLIFFSCVGTVLRVWIENTSMSVDKKKIDCAQKFPNVSVSVECGVWSVKHVKYDSAVSGGSNPRSKVIKLFPSFPSLSIVSLESLKNLKVDVKYNY